MTDELAGTPIGERIQIIRTRRGMTRPVLAGLIGRSPEWLKKIEKSHLLPPRLPMLIKLADVLAVEVVEITGDQSGKSVYLTRREGHETVPAIREAIEETPMTLGEGVRLDSEELEQRTQRAWQLWHSSAAPRADVGTVLPQLIRDCRRAARSMHGDERRKANAALSAIYGLCEQVLAWVADSALPWLAADRCMAAAEQADDPETLAGAAWVLGNVWRSTGREEDALDLARRGAELLTPYLGGAEGARGLWGACQLHAAITAARLGHEGDALHHLDAADDMASRVKGTQPWTLFGRANTDMTAVSVHVDLRKGGKALDKVNAADPDAIPSKDRRARLWLETARAYSQRSDHTATLHVLQRVTNVSAESTRCHPIARGIAGDLLVSGGPMVAREAEGLARQLGVVA